MSILHFNLTAEKRAKPVDLAQRGHTESFGQFADDLSLLLAGDVEDVAIRMPAVHLLFAKVGE